METLEGTLIEKRIELAAREKAPEVYKPRKGLVNGNKEKFTASMLKFILTYLPNLIKQFGYSDIFDPKIENGEFDPDAPWIKEFNARNLKLSISNLYTSNEVTSIMINFP